MQRLVTQQVLVSSASLWEILLTIKIYLEKQIVHPLLLLIYGSFLPTSELLLYCLLLL